MQKPGKICEDPATLCKYATVSIVKILANGFARRPQMEVVYVSVHNETKKICGRWDVTEDVKRMKYERLGSS